MKFFNQLANREFLIFVAIVASAVTLHVRQRVSTDQPAASSGANNGRICESPVASATKAELLPASLPAALPADCMRATTRQARDHALWV
ncbi:hypothetical protein AWB79_01501 [Caballeronia hypogeia]|uniref:Uncharacterized protein n=1 Tax=Caballeronia hypogeia TaxID=1777140 RepID=A0A157ZWR3_9BURK|nr:hypothetical protein AWB79_01501 [Caballeronia hypogeia]